MPYGQIRTALQKTEDFIDPNWTPAKGRAHERSRQRRLNAPQKVFVKPEPVAAKPELTPEPLPNPFKTEPRCATVIRINAEGVMEHWLEEIEKEANDAIPPDWTTTSDQVIHSVCEVSGIGKAGLKSACRIRNHARARQACMFLLVKHRHLSTTKIGHLLGNRDHSTVVHGIRKVGELLADNDPHMTKLIRLSEIMLGVPIHLCSVK